MVVVAAAVVTTGAGLWVWQQGWLGEEAVVVVPGAPELLDPAVRRLVEGAVDEALAAPREAERHGKLGMIYEANTLWPEAREAYRQAARLDRRNRAWAYHLAVSTQEAGDFESALALYRELAAEHPSFAPVRQRLGLALLESGDPAAALEQLEAVQQLEPAQAAGFLGSGMALRLLGRPAEAAPRLERALQLEPANRAAHYQLGLAYRDLGRSEEFERQLARGLNAQITYLGDELAQRIESYAVSLPATVARAERLRQAGRHQEVGALFERALESHPDNLTLLNNLAASLMAQGDFDRARETLDRAREVGGDDPETLLNLAGLALATDFPERAVEYADRALALDRRLARLHGVRAQALVKLGRYDEATASMEEALRLEVRDPALYVGLGVLYELDSRWSDALDSYERALRLWPDLVPAHLGRGLAAVRLGDRAAATESFEELRRLAPGDPGLQELQRALEAM
jgi:tetratricopeptide (TPR) repeat protein